MHLLLSLASVLGLEVDDLMARLRQNAIAWGCVAFLLLIAVAFLLVAANAALVDWLGPVLAPLAIAAVAFAGALAIYAVLRVTAAVAARRNARRRHAAERSAMVTTAAITAVPALMKSPLLRKLGIPVGGALAVAWLLRRSGRNRHSGDGKA